MLSQTAIPSGFQANVSRERAQQLRFECDALLTGIGTILKDDPLLTDRTGQARRRPLLRCVLDSRLQLPLASRLVQSRKEGGIMAFCSPERDPARQNLLEEEGVEVIVVPGENERLSFDSILEELGRREMTSLLIEAGPTVNFSAFQQRVVDKLYCFVAPRILGGVSPLPFVGEPGFINLADGVKLSFSSIKPVGCGHTRRGLCSSLKLVSQVRLEGDSQTLCSPGLSKKLARLAQFNTPVRRPR